ncbi:MAG TPA: GntR family transcriptional regulator [Longimicrobiales bacterium]
MARDQVAGAIILDTLRERIVSGLYVGYWRPGERLPSIREIAEAERVDRKTAAAAYHRLEEEGLVLVRPRSGVYLCAAPPPAAPGPLERLHRQWLQHTFEGARALGLDTRTILRLVGAVADLEQLRLPVIECNWSQAEAIAVELRERLYVQAMPYLLDDLRPGDPVLAEAPVLVTTPYHSAELSLLAPGRVVLETTLAPDVLRELRTRAALERVVVIAGNDIHAQKVRRALAHCGVGPADEPVRIVPAIDRAELAAAVQAADLVFLWPGTPAWVEEALPARYRRIRPRRSISDEALTRIQLALLDAALRRARDASTSIDAAVRR